MKVRPAAVAGTFYPSDPTDLQAQVDKLLAGASADDAPLPRALIVPHAGYIYSGATAAAAYTLLVPGRDKIRRVVLFGPAHRVYLEGMAVPTVDAFSTPLGEIPLDRHGIQTLLKLRGVVESDQAHELEHSLEVQLPFLQTVLDEFTLLPVVVGNCPPQQVASAIDALCNDPDTLLLVSTDLSHFHPYDEARLLDSQTCAKILSRETALGGEEACGAHALNGLMSCQTIRELDIGLIEYCNSGDTAGDRQRVVGYGAFSLH
jgi:AmmeMemoRadiSam system protein B